MARWTLVEMPAATDDPDPTRAASRARRDLAKRVSDERLTQVEDI